MRKLFVAIAVLAFMTNGCAWLGFGDDESTTAQTVQAEPAHEEAAAAMETKTEAPKAAAKTSSKKVATSSKGKKSEAQIKEELDRMGHKLASQSARTLLPNKANKDVKKVGNHWVATYIHVDTDHVSTELRPGANGQYVGFIRYQEQIMECKGDSRQAALSAPCTQVGTRRLNELIRYDGKQWQD